MDNTTTSLTEGVVLISSRLPVTVIGLVENIIVIYLYFRSSKLRDVSMKIIVNLAITDLVTVLAFNLHGLGFTFYRESPYICIGIWLVLIYMILVSQSVLWIATFERYIAICHQEIYKRIMAPKNFLIMIVIAWVAPLILSMLSFLGFNYLNTDGQCFYPTLFHEWVYYIHSSLNIALIMTTLAKYIRIIILKAREFYRRFKPAQVAVVNESSMQIRARQKSIRNGKSMGIITAAFIICYLPFQIYQFRFGSAFNDNHEIVVVLGGLGAFNSLVNPFLYAWQKKEFRSEIGKLIRCRCFKNRVDVEHPTEDNLRQNNKGINRPRQHIADKEPHEIPSAKFRDWNKKQEMIRQNFNNKPRSRDNELDVIEEISSYEDTVVRT